MTQQSPALKAAYAEDTADLLDHIAWTDVIRPKLEEARRVFTDQLVSVTLRPQAANAETREQLAGKLYGISFIITAFESVLKEGVQARETLAKYNFFVNSDIL